ncbi:cobalt-precorrin-5B (C(1))-methyltransferase [Gynuella sp.]|uniref:cobalt-precorrin-5B (C(1))-methyltransferase n=1 Tax=Gynuella sp. TaxID=2969146 RepID=UPI003D0F7522
MWPESSEQPTRLRTGLTTGCCATACCVAAAQLLLQPQRPAASTVSVKLPRGRYVDLAIVAQQRLSTEQAIATTIKDAGDDPDITHGARISVTLVLVAEAGVAFHAGQGVGTVTRDGLPLTIGEPAINPVPRAMMTEHLLQAAENSGYQGGFKVTVAVENGEMLAHKTMNPRLGILGGLSILGTTGIVRPFSCAAYIASIHQGMDVAAANGIDHIAATTGSSSEQAIREHYGLSEMALVEMGDFAGAVLKYLKRVSFARVSLCGGFGKISKLANGHLDLHSRASAIDFEHLANLAQTDGANEALCRRIRSANTSIEALQCCQDHGIDLAQAVCNAAWRKVHAMVPATVAVEVWVTDRSGRLLACARGDEI